MPDLKKKFAQLGKELKALLLLNSCSAYAGEGELMSNDGQIATKFLPPNVTSLIQPMELGVLECLKRIYRKSVLKKLVSQTEDDMLALLRQIDMLRVVEKIACAWEQISSKTAKKSWRELIPLQKSFVQENAISSEAC